MLFQACKRSETDCGDLSDVITNYNISDADKTKIPYTGIDTLVFISNAGDTATLIGQGKNTYYESVRSNIKGGDCPRSAVDNYRGIDIVFKSSNSNFLNASFSLIRYKDNTYTKYSLNNNEIALTNIPYLESIVLPQDSIKINSIYITGNYMGFKSNNVVFNFKYGVLKFKDLNNEIWILNSKR